MHIDIYFETMPIHFNRVDVCNGISRSIGSTKLASQFLKLITVFHLMVFV